MRKKSRFAQSFFFILLIIMALLGINIYKSENCLQATNYALSSEQICERIRIVFLSDLHCRSFGKNNQNLYDLIIEEKPDFIALAGDLFSRTSSEEEISALCEFLSQLTQVVHVFYSLGNHEMDYIQTYGNSILNQLSTTGVTVLENQFIDIELHGQILRIGGTSELLYQHVEAKENDGVYSFLLTFSDTNSFKLMLSHRPEGYYFGDASQIWNIDLILSGHTHGGLIRVPLIGGLYAPIQGFFPDVDYGKYVFNNSTLLITSGLAGYEWLPRVNNLPEIAVVELVPQNDS